MHRREHAVDDRRILFSFVFYEVHKCVLQRRQTWKASMQTGAIREKTVRPVL
jgi:hypothetical protein